MEIRGAPLALSHDTSNALGEGTSAMNAGCRDPGDGANHPFAFQRLEDLGRRVAEYRELLQQERSCNRKP
jgi:hypothetical protein